VCVDDQIITHNEQGAWRGIGKGVDTPEGSKLGGGKDCGKDLGAVKRVEGIDAIGGEAYGIHVSELNGCLIDVNSSLRPTPAGDGVLDVGEEGREAVRTKSVAVDGRKLKDDLSDSYRAGTVRRLAGFRDSKQTGRCDQGANRGDDVVAKKIKDNGAEAGQTNFVLDKGEKELPCPT
jgi:hypothetical protein